MDPRKGSRGQAYRAEMNPWEGPMVSHTSRDRIRGSVQWSGTQSKDGSKRGVHGSSIKSRDDSMEWVQGSGIKSTVGSRGGVKGSGTQSRDGSNVTHGTMIPLL